MLSKKIVKFIVKSKVGENTEVWTSNAFHISKKKIKIEKPKNISERKKNKIHRLTLKFKSNKFLIWYWKEENELKLYYGLF